MTARPTHSLGDVGGVAYIAAVALLRPRGRTIMVAKADVGGGPGAGGGRPPPPPPSARDAAGVDRPAQVRQVPLPFTTAAHFTVAPPLV